MEFNDESGVNSVIFSLWRKEMLDIAFDEDGDPMLTLVESSRDEVKQQDLDEEELELLLDIISSWEEFEEE